MSTSLIKMKLFPILLAKLTQVIALAVKSNSNSGVQRLRIPSKIQSKQKIAYFNSKS